ncbi:two-component system sensor histidine kinase NtrB [Salidesulfovibrio brasiliensis]|uniref:two-component system sensor histidine kinase NtrB n=1 Tax=Salidesulfovibrio brasiliensis TaxID=221711 RepID=UPI001FE18A8A|nr:PAS domain S-box protein [Salidesulfovibrio brasiliensis]
MARQQQLLRTVLDSTPDWVTLQDKDGSFLAVNRAYADSLGLSPESVVGRKETEFLDPEEVHISEEKLARVFATGQGTREEIRRKRDGRTMWMHVIRVPVRGHDGRVNAVLKSARDVTEIKNYQAQLIQAQKMESLGKLAGGVAHEINTPLGIILGYAQLLKEDAQDEAMREDLGIVEKQTKVCRKIVADLLGFSRQSVSEKQEMCFNNSVMEAVTLVRHTFEMERVSIVTVLDERMPIIYGDPEKLKQVWINLLNNARDAMPEGGTIRVATSLNIGRRTVTAFFSDTGPGIEPEHLKKVFDPFFSTKAVGQGTGLGLSVSFGIVEDHEGDITVTSPVPDEHRPETEDGAPAGPGALFTVDLPLDTS